MLWSAPQIFEWTRARVDQGIRIEWGGIDFSSRHLRGETPLWRLRETDWWYGALLDTETTDAGRGVLPLREHFRPRTVTWSGSVHAPSTESLLEQVEALQTARGKMLRVWEGPTDLYRQAPCRPVQAQIDPVSDRIAVYTVTVQLDDPLLMSVDDQLLDPSVKITNTGTTRSYPLVTVDGPTSGAPKVTIGSWSITAPRSLASGEQMIVDCRESDLWVGGARVFPLMKAFPSLAVGASTTISTSRGKGTVQGASAWI